MEWVVLLSILIILGALAGGNSLGETIRKGIGCLVVVFLFFVFFIAIGGIQQ